MELYLLYLQNPPEKVTKSCKTLHVTGRFNFDFIMLYVVNF